MSHAGGTATNYIKWKEFLNKDIELYPLELPGRGKRFSCSLCDTMEDVIEDIFPLVSKEIDNSEYAFFGHSMGTIIIYELMQKITDMGYKDPLHIFFSGRFPPHISEKKKIHMLADEPFKEEIAQLGGIDKELAANPDILEIFLPILRADYKVLEQYNYVKTEPWNFNMSVLSGLEDKEVQEYNYLEWTRYTNKQCCYYEFEGDHFFINNNTEKIVRLINNTLSFPKNQVQSLCY